MAGQLLGKLGLGAQRTQGFQAGLRTVALDLIEPPTGVAWESVFPDKAKRHQRRV